MSTTTTQDTTIPDEPDKKKPADDPTERAFKAALDMEAAAAEMRSLVEQQKKVMAEAPPLMARQALTAARLATTAPTSMQYFKARSPEAQLEHQAKLSQAAELLLAALIKKGPGFVVYQDVEPELRKIINHEHTWPYDNAAFRSTTQRLERNGYKIQTAREARQMGIPVLETAGIRLAEHAHTPTFHKLPPRADGLCRYCGDKASKLAHHSFGLCHTHRNAVAAVGRALGFDMERMAEEGWCSKPISYEEKVELLKAHSATRKGTGARPRASEREAKASTTEKPPTTAPAPQEKKPSLCRVPGCGVADITRGLCKTHYKLAFDLVQQGKTSWDKLVKAGKALPDPNSVDAKSFFLDEA